LGTLRLMKKNPELPFRLYSGKPEGLFGASGAPPVLWHGMVLL